MKRNYWMIIVIIIALLFMYIGTTMFYNTGLGVTDLNLENKDSNNSQYELTYMLRSVRSFEYVYCDYTLLSEDNQEIGKGSTTLENITDGSFQIDETIDRTSDNTSLIPKTLKITIYTEQFDPNNKNNDGSYAQNPFAEFSYDV